MTAIVEAVEAMPGHVLISFPIEEAEALLRELDPVPWDVDTPACVGKIRLHQAVQVERESCGYAEQRQRLSELKGQRIFVRANGVYEGEVRDVTAHDLTISDDPRYGSLVFNLDEIKSFALVDWQKEAA